MKNQTTNRAALIAALSILAAIICIALSMQHENGDAFVEIKPIPTPKATNMIYQRPCSLLLHCHHQRRKQHCSRLTHPQRLPLPCKTARLSSRSVFLTIPYPWHTAWKNQRSRKLPAGLRLPCCPAKMVCALSTVIATVTT